MASCPPLVLEFPERLEWVRLILRKQEAILGDVARIFADAIGAGGVVHAYGNGHSRLAVEELCVRMGALTGFHPILQAGLTTFTDVIGPNGIRLNQAIERVEGLGELLLLELNAGPQEPLLAISATGQTVAAVDIALAWRRRFPANPLILLCSREQARRGAPKHTSGKTFWHIAEEGGAQVHFIDNGMPVGDTSVLVSGAFEKHQICPLSSIGALSVIQCLNELTLRELERRGIRPHVLRNMHLQDTSESYDAWLDDQRQRYARARARPEACATQRT